MEDPGLAARRTPPEQVNRTTRHGADQYVLACNARRDADENTFKSLERLEQENRRLRSEVKWKLEHASTRTGRWVRSRLIILACMLAGIATLTGWMFGPNSRAYRISLVEGYAAPIGGRTNWNERHFLTSDMTQHEIEAQVASRTALDAARVK
jgi:hypothetical protein